MKSNKILLFLFALLLNSFLFECEGQDVFVRDFDDLLENGLLNVNSEDVESKRESLELISSRLLSPTKSSFGKCAVVGCSIELFKSKYGQTIDDPSKYDIVLRTGLYNHVFGAYASPSSINPMSINSLVSGRKTDYMFAHWHELNWMYNALLYQSRTNLSRWITYLSTSDSIDSVSAFLSNNPTVELVLLKKRVVEEAFGKLYSLGATSGDYPIKQIYLVLAAKFMCRESDGFGLFSDDIQLGGYLNTKNPKCIDDRQNDGKNSPNWKLLKSLASKSQEEITSSSSSSTFHLINLEFHDMLYGECRIRDQDNGHNMYITFDRFKQSGENRPYKTCAVVGHAPTILKQYAGLFIDSHDAVFRANDHFAENEEEGLHVGYKTTFMGRQNLPGLTQPPEYEIVDNRMARIWMIRDSLLYDTYEEFEHQMTVTQSQGMMNIFVAFTQYCEKVRLFGYSMSVTDIIHHNFLWETMIYVSTRERYPDRFYADFGASLECYIHNWINSDNLLSMALNQSRINI
jgi:hypothetical protein